MSRSDRDLLRGLARHIRQYALGCFDPDDPDEDERAQELVDWLADNVDVLNIPKPEATERPWPCRPLTAAPTGSIGRTTDE